MVNGPLSAVPPVPPVPPVLDRSVLLIPVSVPLLLTVPNVLPVKCPLVELSLLAGCILALWRLCSVVSSMLVLVFIPFDPLPL